MSSVTARARGLRGALVGVCSALVTSVAHAAAGGGIARGGALMVLLVVCATVGIAVARVHIEGRRTRLAAIASAMAAGQLLGHLVLVAAADHHHGGPAVTLPMVVAHGVATVALSALIAAAEHLYAVGTSVLRWLQLFSNPAALPIARPARSLEPLVIARPVLPRSGAGVRAPPPARAGV